MKGLALAAAAVLLAWIAAGCGGVKQAAPETTTAICHGPAQTRALARLGRDIAALKIAGKVPVKNKLIGGRSVNHATDRFLLDLEKAPISNLQRNRLIDFAARAAIANCEQCFQALEAERPIPAIQHDGNGASCSG